MSPQLLYVLLSYTASLVYLVIGFRALAWNPRGAANRAMFALCAGCALWALAVAFMLISRSEAEARFWYRVSANGWLIAPTAAAHAYLRSHRVRFLLENSWLVVCSYAATAILIVRSWTHGIGKVTLVRADFGWAEGRHEPDVWYVLTLVYIVLLTGSTVAVAGWRSFRGSTPTERLQGRWFFFTGAFLVPVFLGIGFGLPLLGFEVPESTALLALVWVLAFWRALSLDNPMVLEPQLVAAQVIENLLEPVIITGSDGTIGRMNRAAQQLLNTDEATSRFQPLEHLLPVKSIYESVRRHKRIRSDIENHVVEVPTGATGDEGRLRQLSVSTSPLANSLGEVLGVLVHLRDVTESREIEELLRFQATHDPLTGLFNRTMGHQRLTEALGTNAVPTREVAVIVMDLDNFKAVNDRFGHATGDQVLCEVARRLLDAIGPRGTVARLGGDEFLVVLPPLDADGGLADAEGKLAALRHTLAEPLSIQGLELPISASFGLTLSRCLDEPSADDLIQRADRMMYEVKRRGGHGQHVDSADLRSIPDADGERPKPTTAP